MVRRRSTVRFRKGAPRSEGFFAHGTEDLFEGIPGREKVSSSLIPKVAGQKWFGYWIDRLCDAAGVPLGGKIAARAVSVKPGRPGNGRMAGD